MPHSTWADLNLAELAGQPGDMLEHPNQSEPKLPNPGLRRGASPCMYRVNNQPNCMSSLGSFRSELI